MSTLALVEIGLNLLIAIIAVAIAAVLITAARQGYSADFDDEDKA